MFHYRAIEKNLLCPLCDYKTQHAFVLASHLHAHAGEAPYKCPVCVFGATNASYLNKHIARLHPDLVPEPCKTCGQTFATFGLRAKHVSRAHKPKSKREQLRTARLAK